MVRLPSGPSGCPSDDAGTGGRSHGALRVLAGGRPSRLVPRRSPRCRLTQPDLHPARSRTGTPSAEPQQPHTSKRLAQVFPDRCHRYRHPVGASVAGYGPVLGNSALLISAIALAIGVAAQEVIGSLVSGIALVLDPDFNVGDYIEWPNGEGVVQSIALRTTRVETQNGELVTIPNTILTNNEISRPFGRGTIG